MRPGDIVAYRERGATLNQDRIVRATYVTHEGAHMVLSRGGERFVLCAPKSDVVRVEPSQWGWTGAPAKSGAW